MSTAKYIFKLVATLFVITALVAAALGGVNAITADRIEALNAEKINSAIAQVLPGEGSPKETPFTDATGTVKKVWKGEQGYAVQVEPNGFGGAITMMVGVSNEGKVLGVQVVSHTETPGLGAKAAGDGAVAIAFRNSFVGLSGNVTVSKDGGQADTLTGATITSRAVAAGVSAALAVKVS